MLVIEQHPNDPAVIQLFLSGVGLQQQAGKPGRAAVARVTVSVVAAASTTPIL